MTQMIIGTSAQQEQLAKTSVVNCGTQPHSVVASEPKTGMFNGLLYFDHELKRYSWLRKDRPRWLFAEKCGLQPDRLADEQKCRLLVERGGDCNIRYMKGVSPRSLDSGSDLLFAPCGSKFDRSLPTLSWLEIPYTRVRRDTCKRKRRDRVGVDHLKVHGRRTITPTSRGCGYACGVGTRRLKAAYAKLGPAQCAEDRKPKQRRVIAQPVKNAAEQMRAAGAQEDSSNGGVSLPELLAELRVLHGDWETLPSMRKIVILTLLTRSKMQGSLSESDRAGINSSRSKVFVLMDRLCKNQEDAPQRAVIRAELQAALNEWLAQVVLVEADSRYFTALYQRSAPFEQLGYIPHAISSQDWWRSIPLGVKFQVPPHAPSNYYGPYTFGVLTGRNNSDRTWTDIADSLFWRHRPVSFEYEPWMSDFTPSGSPPHWAHGGKELFIARAVLWGVMNLKEEVQPGDRPDQQDIIRMAQLLESPGVVIDLVSTAVASGLEAASIKYMGPFLSIREAVSSVPPDFVNTWMSESIMKRPAEYSTILENLLQMDIKYWDRIEPFLRAIFVGWLVGRGMESKSPSDRIKAMLGACVAMYMEHTLTSRTLNKLCQAFKDLLEKWFGKLMECLEALWRKMSNEAREQSYTGELFVWMSRVFAVADSAMFTKIMETVSVIGAIFTCPWSNMAEADIVSWANNVLTNLAQTTFATAKKLSFLEKLWEIAKFFFTRARFAWQAQDPLMFFYGRDDFVALVDKVNIVSAVSKSLHTMTDSRVQCLVKGVPYNLDTYRQLMTEIGKSIDKIQKDVDKGVVRELPGFVSAAMTRYAICAQELDEFDTTQRNRPLPFAIFMVGPPSAGKNSIMDDIIRMIFDQVEFLSATYVAGDDGIPRFTGFDKQKLKPSVYTKNPFDKYDSGFTNRHNVISFIEPGCFNVGNAMGAEQSFNQIAGIFNFLDTAPYSPVMADVDSKGKMSASTIQLAVLTANNIDLHKDIMRDQMALARRLGKAIKMEVKPAFKDRVTSGLNKDLMRGTEFKMDDDMWIFTIYTPVTRAQWEVNNPTTEIEWVVDTTVGHEGKFYTNRDYMDWLIGRVEKHVAEQARIMLQGAKTVDAKTCTICRRWNHECSDHCTACGGISHFSEAHISHCGEKYRSMLEAGYDCRFCRGDNPGCTGCDEMRWAKKTQDFARFFAASWNDETRHREITIRARLPCFCAKCYRTMSAHIGNKVKCYGCGHVGDHTYAPLFLAELRAMHVDKTSEQAAEAFAHLDDWDRCPSCGYDTWEGSSLPLRGVYDILRTEENPFLYQRGVEQMNIKEVAGIAACSALVGAAAMYCWRPTITVRHEVAGSAGELVSTVNSATKAICQPVEVARKKMREWTDLCAFSESEWFDWARLNVIGLMDALNAIGLSSWLKLAGLAVMVIGFFRYFQNSVCGGPSIVDDVSSGFNAVAKVVRQTMFKYGQPSQAISQGRGIEQMKVFDSKFVESILEQFGVQSGARASYPSDRKIDNPWLNMPQLAIRENIGARKRDLGEKQGEIASARIEKSIYMLGSLVVLDDSTSLQHVNMADGSRIHCMLLSGGVFVVNTHFLVHAIISQVNAKRIFQLDSANVRHSFSMTKLTPEAEEIAELLDWQECVERARAHGVRGVYLGVASKFYADGCPGVSSQQWEYVDFINIVGNIYTDVALVRFNRFVAPAGAGLVRGDKRDLRNSLFIPREHTAPTDALLVTRSMSDDADNRAVAVFKQNVHFEFVQFGKERSRFTDVWSFPVASPTADGDCGLPLVGVWHTKYSTVTDDDGHERKIVDISGDTVFVLGMHRIYQSAARVSHSAPLSIDIISQLWGQLDDQASAREQDLQNWKLFSLPDFDAGVLPTRVPKVDMGHRIDGELDLARFGEIEFVDIVFRRGERNQFHDKSPLQWMGIGKSLHYAPEMGEAYALHGVGIGSTSGFRQGMFSSGVTRLPTANWFGYEQRHVAPRLNDKHGKEINLVALSGAHDGELNYALLRRVANDMVVETIANLDKVSINWRKNVHPISDVETVAGSTVANFMPGVNRQTGMGYPIYGAKTPHIEVSRDKGGEAVSFDMRDEVLFEIGRNISAYMKHQRANPVFTATPKDERLGSNKVIPLYDVQGNHVKDVHNLRIFLCGSYPFVHLQRQQYLSIVRLICEYPEVFEMAVGTNVASRRWGLMRDWLTWDGQANTTILAGDYSKFDKRMTATWVRVAFEVLISLMVESGNYTSADLDIASGIALDTACPLIDWFGDWIMLTNGHPSGHALTTIINGIVNRLYLRYAYYILCQRHLSFFVPYRMCVRTYVYGDDNISGVIGEATKFFTMPNISFELRKVGVILTTEDKSAIVDDFTTIWDAAFLKRKWVDMGGIVAAPLARKSIEAMVTVGILNREQVTTQMYQLLRSYCDEFFHYGKEEHDKARESVIALCRDLQYWVEEGFPLVGRSLSSQLDSMGDTMFPTFEQVLERWFSAEYVHIY